MRDMLTTFGELAGIILIAVGFGLLWFPLGVIAAGVGLFVVSFAAGDT